MKAMTAAHDGGPETIRLQEVPTPTTGDDEVLVDVRATTPGPGGCWRPTGAT